MQASKHTVQSKQITSLTSDIQNLENKWANYSIWERNAQLASLFWKYKEW